MTMASDGNHVGDSEELVGSLPEKRQKIDDGDESPEKDDSDDSDDSVDSLSMTEEEYKPYIKMVKESNGYYVPELGSHRALWTGYIRQLKRDDEDLLTYAQYAIEYNKTNTTETEKKNLKFVKVVNGTCRLTGYMELFITFEAEDETTGEIALYQAMVAVPFGGGDIEVDQFRLKPLVVNNEQEGAGKSTARDGNSLKTVLNSP